MHADSGHPAFASQSAVSGLRSGSKVNGALLVVTRSGVRIFKPPTSKGAGKSLDNLICQAGGVSRYEDKGYALIILNSDGFARAYAIPALREIASARVAKHIDPVRYDDAIITPSGDILGWTGPAEAALINVWGKGLVL
jgi:syntaxin-binding protein 5